MENLKLSSNKLSDLNPKKTKIIIFASGTKTGGGSGFSNFIKYIQTNKLSNIQVQAVVSNHQNGGVCERAKELNVPFRFFPPPRDSKAYSTIVKLYEAQYCILMGWLLLVPIASKHNEYNGLDPKTTINIHPGPLPKFGGKGMYGRFVHEAVLKAYQSGEVFHTGPTIHFATEEYDQGPKVFFKSTAIEDDDTAASIADKVNAIEHAFYPYVITLILKGDIYWDGEHPGSLALPENYEYKWEPYI